MKAAIQLQIRSILLTIFLKILKSKSKTPTPLDPTPTSNSITSIRIRIHNFNIKTRNSLIATQMCFKAKTSSNRNTCQPMHSAIIKVSTTTLPIINLKIQVNFKRILTIAF